MRDTIQQGSLHEDLIVVPSGRASMLTLEGVSFSGIQRPAQTAQFMLLIAHREGSGALDAEPNPARRADLASVGHDADHWSSRLVLAEARHHLALHEPLAPARIANAWISW